MALCLPTPKTYQRVCSSHSNTKVPRSVKAREMKMRLMTKTMPLALRGNFYRCVVRYLLAGNYQFLNTLEVVVFHDGWRGADSQEVDLPGES